nr:transglycosylase domain-containing protein [Clostridia bacterium]
MKNKAVRIILIILGIFLLLTITAFSYYFIATANINLDKSKLINMNSQVEIYDDGGNLLEEYSGDRVITDASLIPEYTLNAFVAIEDKRFYSHNGVDIKGLFRAAFNNVKSFSFKEGASTISQQLIKNTHLSGEKTLNRKLAELKLARQLEKDYSKREILEMYVNTIYFGDGYYGITQAANGYFGVSPENLTISQSAALAGTVKAPAVYSPRVSTAKCNERRKLVLKEMLEQNFITKQEYDDNISAEVSATERKDDLTSPYIKLVKDEIRNFLDQNAYKTTKLKVYTYYDKNLQSDLEQGVKALGNTNTDKKAVILNDKNKIQAFYSTCGDIPRRLGSTLKPVAVYAPAIDMGAIDACTPINDEKTDFGGYSPSNYNDAYYGYVSAKFALAKSLNSCAVKVLNGCGIENCLKYLKKTDIPITEKDNSLKLALGYTENGATLTEISGAYGTFVNKGVYIKPTAVKKICDKNGNVLYKDGDNSRRIFGEDTAYILNDMLKSTVKEGTAKTLSSLNFPLAAKTGTVGNADGNTDAYTVSYNGDYILACWVGNADSALMDNSVSGGTLPAKMCLNAWQNMRSRGYSPHDTFETDKVAKINIDKITYQENHLIEEADENAPKKYILTELFKKDRIPKRFSERFTTPKVESAEISVNYCDITIRLCLPDYCDYKVFRESGRLKVMVFDSKGQSDKTQFTDKNLMPNSKYSYTIVPYYAGKNGIKYGEEYRLKEIKTPPINFDGDEWWDKFFDFGF